MCNPEINLRKLEKIHIYKKKRKVFGQDIGFCSLRQWSDSAMGPCKLGSTWYDIEEKVHGTTYPYAEAALRDSPNDGVCP
jgi:hypothetical protein